MLITITRILECLVKILFSLQYNNRSQTLKGYFVRIYKFSLEDLVDHKIEFHTVMKLFESTRRDATRTRNGSLLRFTCSEEVYFINTCSSQQ